MTVTASDVFKILEKHILVDGFRFVLDLKNSYRCYLRDELTGKDYFDFFTFFASLPLGMNHPKMQTPAFKNELLEVAVNKPSNSDVYTTVMAKTVANFSRVGIPEYLPHLFFITGGTLAVENCLKVAFDWKIRKNLKKGKGEKGSQIIHFKQAFHGRSGYSISLTNTADTRKTQYFPKFDWPRIENPKLKYPVTEQVLEDVKKAEAHSVSQIKDALKNNPDDIAALIIEPIQGEGGDNHFRNEFFIQLRNLADENEFLLIFDEVQTGMGITGKMWAHQHSAIKPDLLAFGKKTQECGLLAGPRIDEIEENVFRVPSRINSTFGGNLVDMCRFARILEIYEQENVLENVSQMGAYLKNSLEKLVSRWRERITNLRGMGLMISFDLPDSKLRDNVRDICFEQRLIILPCGEKSLRFRPMLVITKEELDEGISRLEKALEVVFN